MAQAHHRAVVGPGRDLELRRDRGPVDDQAVVPRRLERARAGRRTRPCPSWRISDVLPCMISPARTTSPPYTWPMHWWPRHTPSTGRRPAKCRITSFDSPASSGRPGPGRDQHGVGVEGHDLVEGQLVVPVHQRLGPQLAQVLHEVVDEAVVVVDDQDPGRHAGQATGGRPRAGPVNSPCPRTAGGSPTTPSPAAGGAPPGARRHGWPAPSRRPARAPAGRPRSGPGSRR